MSVNIYVMPLWRFLAGDFDPPLSRLGIPFKRLSPATDFDDHAYRLIFMAFDQLRTAARISRQHNLPIIYEG